MKGRKKGGRKAPPGPKKSTPTMTGGGKRTNPPKGKGSKGSRRSGY